MRTRIRLPLILSVLVVSALAPGGCARRIHANKPDVPVALPVVQAFFAAFNDHDPKIMVGFVDPDVEWLSLEGASISVEARGRDALGSAMTGYFQSTKNVQTVMEAALASGPYVTVQERVFWDAADGAERSQVALAVYEVRDGLIRRVWYFPAEKTAP